MGRWRAIIPIVLAICIAIVGSVLTFKWVKHQTTPKEGVVEEDNTVVIAVAVVDLPWGTLLAGNHIKTASFFRESLPAGYFEDPASLEGRVLIHPVKKNEPILESRLAPTSVTSGGISALIKPGNRALAVKGDKVLGLSGHIKPGDRVDVLVTLTDKRWKREVTKIVLESILVLATGIEVQENDKGEASPVDVYTLEVTPEEGEKLALAANQGRLQFALRNVMDTETVLTSGATVTKTLNSFNIRRAHKKKPKAKAPEPVIDTVKVIKGTKVTNKSF